MCGCRRVLWRWRTSGREVAETEVGKESIVKGWGAEETGKVGSKDTGEWRIPHWKRERRKELCWLKMINTTFEKERVVWMCEKRKNHSFI